MKIGSDGKRYTGVLFDLFGTLVPPFRRREHGDVIHICSAHLCITADECHQGWVSTFPEGIRGKFASVAENAAWIVGEQGERVEQDAVRAEEH